ncbi:MAG: family N-acetyltransferase [Mycobacterium sp.]|nr:family N-acetyltransferase [Mycobacterium sp.]
MDHVLWRLERYFDALPRLHAQVEQLGPLVVFRRGELGWPTHARPALLDDERSAPVGADDLRAVAAAADRLGERPQVEWLEEVAPTATQAAEEAGLTIERQPVLATEPGSFVPASLPSGLRLSELGPTDDLDPIRAMAVGADPEIGLPAVGGAVRWAAFDGLDPVAAGSHSPWDGVTQVLGVTTDPNERHRAIGLAMISSLTADAFGRGVDLVVLAAADDEVAGMAASLGFRQIATRCVVRL